MSTSASDSPAKKLLIVVGSQRSGTTMMMQALARSRAIEVFHETGAVMRDFRLISIEHLRATLARLARPAAAIKPLCDSQWVDHMLANIDGSRAVWMFRRWSDVGNSSVRKWPGHFLEVAERFRSNDLAWLGWRAERIEPETEATFRGLLEHVVDDVGAAAACWWLRNQRYFDLGLDEHFEVVRPVGYEPLVTAPAEWIRRVVQFAGLPFSTDMVADVHSRSVARDRAPQLPAAIGDACDRLHARLAACARAAWPTG